MNTRETATLLLLHKVVSERLAEQARDARTLARDVFDTVGVRDVGVIGDEPIGTVQLNKGRVAWSVVDDAALLAFVKDTFPEQVETVQRVRPAYVTALLAEIKARGAAVTAAGEIVPGVECSTGDPTLMVKASPEAADIIARAFAEGRLTLGDLAAPAALEAAS